MRLHERYFATRKAELDAERAIMEIWEANDMTWGEIVAFHAKQLQVAGKYIVRDERYGEAIGVKGDEEVHVGGYCFAGDHDLCSDGSCGCDCHG